ncbi:PREDICTED: uncharacterized protein K02A2.6-like [Vollenhovia emeryi]|uniref:uncharacterized protein K02A2.6-like n=1 Tax=Vollenhovia emeryi TaxID=411798 RepID=UPI0005F51468|nr:PREDICTED: uncharacterized protein K02A2.6-like [Vollenhovia emeryi]
MQTRLILDKLGQAEFDRLVDHVAPTDPSSMTTEVLITTLKELFRDKIPLTRRLIEILNYRYDRSTPITEHLDRINRHAADFDRSNLTDDNLRILLLLQSFCFSADNDELKRIALRVVEKNQAASLKDVVAELEAYLNVASGLKTLENPTKHSQVAVLNVAHSKNKGKVAPKRKSPPEADTSKAQPSSATKKGNGGAHPRAKCPFREAVCHKCSGKGHIAKVCRSNGSSQEQPESSAKAKSVVSQSLSAVGKRRRHYVNVFLLGKSVSLQYDTGSDVTALGREGKIHIDVASRNGVNLFGLNAIDSLNLWTVPLAELRPSSPASDLQCASSQSSLKSSNVNSTREQPSRLASSDNHEVTSQHNVYLENVLKRFPVLFSKELGRCRNFKVKFFTSDDARPRQIPCRQIPYAMESLLAEELQRLEENDIIEPMVISNWTSPMVIVKKRNGKLRLCVDYSTSVNQALHDNKFKRLPFGIKTAPANFQQAIDSTLAGLEGVNTYIDDVIVRGSTRQEHDERLRKTLQRLQDQGWRLSAEKCRFSLEEIKYLGLIINAQGISPDPDATTAIANMPKPTSVAEVQSFL